MINKLVAKLRSANEISANDLAAELGEDISSIYTMLLTLEFQGICTLSLQIQHDQCVFLLPFGAGFPSMPHTCSKCGRDITLDEMRFDVLAKIIPAKL